MAWFVPVACIDDKTTTAFRAGSPIEISVQDTIVYQDFGLPVVIEPEITQALPDLPLKYEWRCIATDGSEGSDSLRFISTEKVLNYKFPRAGVFRLRLRVENQFGSSFLYFRVNIQAPFEQGLLLLSNDEQDNSRISFLRLKEENELLEKENTDFNLNAFEQANSDVMLHGARDVIFTHTGTNSSNYVLAISSEPEQKIYFLNGRYFLIENIAKEYMLTARVYEAVKSDVEYTRDKTVQYIKAKDMIVEYIKKHGFINRMTVQELCGFSNQQARRTIEKMRKENIIVMSSGGKYAKYIMVEP